MPKPQSLKLSSGVIRLAPLFVVLISYGVAFYFLSLTLCTLPIGVAYAVWSGTGVALISPIGSIVFGQTLAAYEIAGIGFIVVGVVLLNL